MTVRACSSTLAVSMFSGASSGSGIEGDERPGVIGRTRRRRSPSSGFPVSDVVGEVSTGLVRGRATVRQACTGLPQKWVALMQLD